MRTPLFSPAELAARGLEPASYGVPFGHLGAQGTLTTVSISKQKGLAVVTAKISTSRDTHGIPGVAALRIPGSNECYVRKLGNTSTTAVYATAAFAKAVDMVTSHPEPLDTLPQRKKLVREHFALLASVAGNVEILAEPADAFNAIMAAAPKLADDFWAATAVRGHARLERSSVADEDLALEVFLAAGSLAAAAQHRALPDAERLRQRVTRESDERRYKAAVALLDQGASIDCCSWCGSRENIELDHVVAQLHGGHHDVTNRAPLCGSCNRRKGARQAFLG